MQQRRRTRAPSIDIESACFIPEQERDSPSAGMSIMHCRTVEDCDEILSYIADMRLNDAASPAPAPAVIDDLEISLQRERAKFAEHREQEIIACRADVCSSVADTQKDVALDVSLETSLETSLQRRLSSLQWSDGSGENMQRRRTRAPSIGIIPEQEHDSPSLISFDADLIAAAANPLTGSRSEVKAAMQTSMRQMRPSVW